MINITIDGQKIELVPTFKYLVAVISEVGWCPLDVKTRCAVAQHEFNKRKPF